MKPSEKRKLLKEAERIKKLKAEGLTLAEIANQLNKSIYYIHSRVKKDYMPKKIKILADTQMI